MLCGSAPAATSPAARAMANAPTHSADSRVIGAPLGNVEGSGVVIFKAFMMVFYVKWSEWGQPPPTRKGELWVNHLSQRISPLLISKTRFGLTAAFAGTRCRAFLSSRPHVSRPASRELSNHCGG